MAHAQVKFDATALPFCFADEYIPCKVVRMPQAVRIEWSACKPVFRIGDADSTPEEATLPEAGVPYIHQ